MCCISAETACFLIVSVTMVSAAYHDLRSREVPEVHWSVISVVAGSMCIFRLDGPIHAILGILSVSMMAVYMLSDRVSGPSAIPFLAAPVLIDSFLYIDGEGPWVLLVPVMYLLFLVLYHLGLLRGGADAKAMMSLSMAVPFYPWPGVLWASGPVDSVLMNPPFVIFAMALVLSLSSVVPVLCRSVSDGSVSASRYRMPLDEAESSFVWPLEDVVDGCVRRIHPPDDPGSVYGRLRRHGCTDVEVTPMIPFVVPITVSYVAVMVLGNPLVMLV